MNETPHEPDPRTAPHEALPDASAEERTADAAEHTMGATREQEDAEDDSASP